jgi:hypothetical protein
MDAVLQCENGMYLLNGHSINYIIELDSLHDCTTFLVVDFTCANTISCFSQYLGVLYEALLVLSVSSRHSVLYVLYGCIAIRPCLIELATHTDQQFVSLPDIRQLDIVV